MLEQGISKAGNRRVCAPLIQLAWLWLRYQPQRKHSRWFQERFGGGSKRQRRIGIVAFARRQVIDRCGLSNPVCSPRVPA